MSMQSPLQYIPIQDEKQIVAAVQPLKFWIKYKPVFEYTEINGKSIPKDTGQVRGEEWVEYAKKGVSIPATTPQRISFIQRAAAKATEPDDEAAALWRAIKPYYDNWKAGGEADAVISGTPLSIWPGVTRDVVEALKAFKLYSVEDLSTAADSVLQRIPDPNIVMYRDRARKYLSTKDIAVAVRDLTNAHAELAALREQVAALQKAHADSEMKRAEVEKELDDATPAAAKGKKRVKEAA